MAKKYERKLYTRRRGALGIVRKYFPDVTAVKDAKKSIDISVLDKDASSRAVKNHVECAMAVACQRQENADGVIISIHTAYLIKDKIATRYVLPESVSREVVSFDRNGGFATGDYQLRRPWSTHRLGERRTRADNRVDSHGVNSSKRHAPHITTNVRTSLLES